MLWLILIVVVVVLAGVAWLAWRASQKRRLPASSVARYLSAWKSAVAIPDPHRRVMETEKIIDQAMKELGYEGSFADKLRKAGPRFSDTQGLWSAHKLRNRIAHEMELSLSEREVQSAVLSFERALKDLS